MTPPAVDFSLYLATDPHWLAGRDLCAVVEAAVAAGVTVVQLREKEASAAAFFETGRRLLALTRRLGVPLIINDRVDVMLALDADGVHVGKHDLPLAMVRRLVGPGKLVGYSVTSREDLDFALANGADHVGIGPVFSTSTKLDAAPPLGLAGFRQLASSSTLPSVAIGGITVDSCAPLLAAGAAGVCVISAILGNPDAAIAAQRFRQSIDAARQDKKTAFPLAGTP
jgi:thiamine-phosphate pyrophosphorylase